VKCMRKLRTQQHLKSERSNGFLNYFKLLGMWANKSDLYINKFICQNAIINQIGLVVILSP